MVGGNGVGKVGAATRRHKVRGGWLDDGCCTGYGSVFFLGPQV